MAEDDSLFRDLKDDLKDIRKTLDSKTGIFINTSLLITLLAVAGTAGGYIFNLYIEARNALSESETNKLTATAEGEKLKIEADTKLLEAKAFRFKVEAEREKKNLEEARQKLEEKEKELEGLTSKVKEAEKKARESVARIKKEMKENEKKLKDETDTKIAVSIMDSYLKAIKGMSSYNVTPKSAVVKQLVEHVVKNRNVLIPRIKDKLGDLKESSSKKDNYFRENDSLRMVFLYLLYQAENDEKVRTTYLGGILDMVEKLNSSPHSNLWGFLLSGEYRKKDFSKVGKKLIYFFDNGFLGESGNSSRNSIFEFFNNYHFSKLELLRQLDDSYYMALLIARKSIFNSSRSAKGYGFDVNAEEFFATYEAEGYLVLKGTICLQDHLYSRNYYSINCERSTFFALGSNASVIRRLAEKLKFPKEGNVDKYKSWLDRPEIKVLASKWMIPGNWQELKVSIDVN